MDNKTNVFSKKYVTGEGSWTTLTNNEKKDIKVIKYLKDWGIVFTRTTEKTIHKKEDSLGHWWELTINRRCAHITSLKCFANGKGNRSRVSNRCNYSKKTL